MSLPAAEITRIAELARLAKLEKNRQWRLRNREYLRAYNARRAKLKRVKRAKAEYRKICPERVRAQMQAWVARHPNYYRERYQRQRQDWLKGGKYYVAKMRLISQEVRA